MQYVLTKDEFDALQPQQELTVDELKLYLIKLPHCGPATVNGIIRYFAADGIKVMKGK